MLLLGTVSTLVVLIILDKQGVLPLDGATFLFLCFVYFLFSLYRPGWSFLLGVGLLPLETINVAPSFLGGIMLRPYQMIVVILSLALVFRYLLGRLPFRLFQPRLYDVLPVLIGVGSFIGLIHAPVLVEALKQALVVGSFVVVYFLGRIFFRTLHDVKQAAPFFVASSLVVFGYALWQNIQYRLGGESFQVMIGRPNATFSEADWLGLYGIVALGVGMVLLINALDIFSQRLRKKQGVYLWYFASGLYLSLVFMVLLLTVARSAWLGATALGEVIFLAVLLSHGIRKIHVIWKKAALFFFIVSTSFFVAWGTIAFFDLSPFQFWNRIQSTGSGWQKITIACMSADTVLPRKIESMNELTESGCRHIALEEREDEERVGHVIREVYRDDPNIVIRKDIYGQAWSVIKQHPVLGIGWGSITKFLGADERGAGLNASNVFLEVWLGSGLLGIASFLAWWFLIVYAAIRLYRETLERSIWMYGIFILAEFAGVAVFNLFNSGILLGFYFMLFSLGVLLVDLYFESQK